MNVAILGAGAIAHAMADTLTRLQQPEIHLTAIGSRSLEKARDFATTYNLPKAYGSYAELAADPEIDLIYIASPHSEHAAHAKLCLEHGKHLLVEKAFTKNAAEARDILALAKEKQLLITEAIWTRYMPSRRIIDEVIASGALGEVHSVQANLGYPITHKERIMRPELAGGALLDLTVYPINFALMAIHAGVKDITGTCVKADTGVDLLDNVAITFDNGALASLHATAYSPTDRMGYIYGTKGYLAVTNINNPEKVELFDKEHRLVQRFPLPQQITGYEYQVIECLETIKAGNLECPSMPHSETVHVMELMDSLRKLWEIKFPGE